MEQPSSSSKVTVEYYDPYGVYQLLSPGLLPRLPLRNLHWESHAGPLRSISSLHVDLVPDAQAPSAAVDTPSASTSDLTRVRSEDSTASRDDGFRTQTIGQVGGERPGSAHGVSKRVKERRHQIPGLRQTPYLKVLLLRCDDNDTYKAQARKQVREWVKEHAPSLPTSSKVSSQENHDAFEWLIVHVIVPNTAAATQPRTSKGTDGTSSSASEKSTARWRGGGSSTILEKLRADFNGSSRSAVDRIAQIRIGVNDVPYDMLPRVVPAIPGSYTESQQENDNAWLDLITKFKERILASFDVRVSQYEEDIREKDGQRSLPGWNFCTFFVLKEGLARGFESVGLVEDALVGYDELSIGLDAIIREHRIRVRVGAGPQHGASFLSFTEDLKRGAEQARIAILRDLGLGEDNDGDDPIDLQSTNESSVSDVDEIPLNVQKKRYRELILANDISIFDFRCYVFARQLTLLLRKANASSSTEELLAKLKEQRESSLHGIAARLPPLPPSEDAEDLTILGEICRRSMDFVASIARVMREDIWAAQMHGQQGQFSYSGREKPRADPVMIQVVDNMVSSFTFSVAQQILAQTSTKALPIPPSTLAPPTGLGSADGQEPKSAIPEPKTMMHPARTSSLALRSSSREPPSPGLFPGARRPSLQDSSVASSSFLKAGLEELAAHRAELYILSRNVLEQVGQERGWVSGWGEITHLKGDNVDEMEEIDLSREPNADDHEENRDSKSPPSSHGIENKLLKTALQDENDFYRLYETLTDKALRHFTVANHVQSSYSSMADLAILKYHLKDYAATASYFYRLAPFYGDDGWAQVELSMLVMWAKCLKELQRMEEYVRVVVKLLSKAAMIEKERLMRKASDRFGRTNDSSKHEPVSTASYLPELLVITKELPHELQVPLENFFGYIEVDATPQYHPEQDSFSLQIRLRYLLSDDLTIEKAKLRISMINGDSNRDVWLETDGSTLIQSGTATMTFWSNVVVPGAYLVNCVIFYTNNVVMRYEHSVTGALAKTDKFFRCRKLLIYHRPETFDVRLFASRYMHLNRTRYLEVGLFPGWNEVSSVELHLRAATAGLRLQTSAGEVVAGSAEITRKSEASIIRVGVMSSYSNMKLRLPFNLEHEVNDIALRVEVIYKTEKGTFQLAKTLTMSIMLPLGVNVQDVFKHESLFSKFTISSATASPLRLLSSRLESSDLFSAESGTLTTPISIFPRQPASMLYKISKISKASESNRGPKKDSKSSLSLVLNYVCLEEEIDEAIRQGLQAILNDTPLQPYSRLVIPTVLEEIRTRLSPYDLERIAILSEIPTSILPTIKWRNYFTGLGRTEKGEDIATVLAERLHKWQKDTAVIPLLPISIDQDALATSRSIIIPVDVPSVAVGHTADLKIDGSSSVPANTAVAALNQPLSACLVLKSTRQWDTAYLAENDSSNRPEYYEFCYEISGAADTWLIGGRRKGHFRVPTKVSGEEINKKTSFPVVLIPLREGFLPFPTVEIKSVPATKTLRPASTGRDSVNTAKQPVVTCETDCKNIGETIRVISDAWKTTVSLDASGPQGGAWLLESERRAAGNDGAVSV